MPYIIKPKRLCMGLAAATAAMAVAAAPALAEEPQCEAQPFSQPFSYVNDLNNYVLVPGESANAFGGEGWELSGGAQVTETTLADGSSGSVLELPGGSSAVSPTFCVTTAYPKARVVLLEPEGHAPPHPNFGVSYEGTPSWTHPHNTGQLHVKKHGQWEPSASVDMHPEHVVGWQRVRITLSVPRGPDGGAYQLYDLYVDPYSR